MYECGLHGLWRALQYHQDGRGQKFTTSLYRFVDWECKKELKRITRKKKFVSIDALPIEVETNGAKEDVDHLAECLTLLPQKESQLVDMYYFRDMTLEEIGRNFGFTKEAARQKVNKAIEKLRKIYTKH